MRRSTRWVLALVAAVIGPASAPLALGLPGSVAGATAASLPAGLKVFTGYADVRDGVNFPTPWAGDANVTVIGDGTLATASDPDEAAVRIDNTTAAPITVNDVKVVCGSTQIDPWGSNTIPAGATYILTGTTGVSTDTSDFCPLAGVTVAVTVSTTTTTFADDAHAFDPASSSDESQPWYLLSKAPAAPKISGKPPVATDNTPYNFGFTLSGGPSPTTTLTSGTLPPGLSLSAAGVISGTPYGPAGKDGPITVTAHNGVGSASTTFSITVKPSLAISPAGGVAGTPVSISGEGFVPYSEVLVKYTTGVSPPSVTLCDTQANYYGAISCSGQIPAAPQAGASGPHKVTASAPSVSTTFTLS
jgi:hypothetical protein